MVAVAEVTVGKVMARTSPAISPDVWRWRDRSAGKVTAGMLTAEESSARVVVARTSPAITSTSTPLRLPLHLESSPPPSPSCGHA